MKLEIALVAFIAAFVPQVVAQTDAQLFLRLMGSDIRLPPQPPKILTRSYHRTREHYRQLKQRHDLAQEMQLFRRLKAMPRDKLRKFQEGLSRPQLEKLVSRIRFLNGREAELKQRQQSGHTGSTAGPNTVLSGASRVRRPGKGSNSASAAPARRGRLPTRSKTSSRRLSNPFDAIRKYQSYRKKATSAIAAGCTAPMALDMMESFMAFSTGGCRTGAAVCMMSGQSCVEVGMSIMCCPPGFSSGTLSMLSYFNQMQSFMAQFQ